MASARKLIGATNPLAAEPGTIRGDYAIEVGRNVVVWAVTEMAGWQPDAAHTTGPNLGSGMRETNPRANQTSDGPTLFMHKCMVRWAVHAATRARGDAQQ